MGRAAAANGADVRQRDPFRGDEDHALEVLRLAWGDAYDIGSKRGTGRWRAVVPPGLIPGDGTRTTLGAWDLGGLMDQLDAIYPAKRSGDR